METSDRISTRIAYIARVYGETGGRCDLRQRLKIASVFSYLSAKGCPVPRGTLYPRVYPAKGSKHTVD